MESDAPTSKLNNMTFAVRKGDQIWVAVPVLHYRAGGDDREADGFAQMNELFAGHGQPDEFEAIQLRGNWCSLDPQNTDYAFLDPQNTEDEVQMSDGQNTQDEL